MTVFCTCILLSSARVHNQAIRNFIWRAENQKELNIEWKQKIHRILPFLRKINKSKNRYILLFCDWFCNWWLTSRTSFKKNNWTNNNPNKFGNFLCTIWQILGCAGSCGVQFVFVHAKGIGALEFGCRHHQCAVKESIDCSYQWFRRKYEHNK